MASSESGADDDLDESRKSLLQSLRDDEKAMTLSQSRRLFSDRRTREYLVVILLLVSIATNAYWIWWRATVENRLAGELARAPSLAGSIVAEDEDHTYYGTSTKVPTPYFFQWFDFARNESSVYNDTLWLQDMPVGGGRVSLPRSLARSMDLTTSYSSPLNPTHELFLMEGYHQVHCLIMLKDTIFNLNSTSPEPTNWDHILHCLDALRQALWCHLDDTLLAVNTLAVETSASRDEPPVVDGQLHQCANRTALKRWTELYAVLV